jgi:hypothetical protein
MLLPDRSDRPTYEQTEQRCIIDFCTRTQRVTTLVYSRPGVYCLTLRMPPSLSLSSTQCQFFVWRICVSKQRNWCQETMRDSTQLQLLVCSNGSVTASNLPQSTYDTYCTVRQDSTIRSRAFYRKISTRFVVLDELFNEEKVTSYFSSRLVCRRHVTLFRDTSPMRLGFCPCALSCHDDTA